MTGAGCDEAVQGNADDSVAQLNAIERFDRIRCLLVIPTSISVGLVLIAPLALLLIAYQRWDHGLRSRAYVIASGIAFVACLLLASVLSIIQWQINRRLYRRCLFFSLRDLERIPFPSDITVRFGPYRLNRSSGIITAQRPFPILWRLHRVALMIAAFVLFVIDADVVVYAYQSISIMKLVKLVLVMLFCLATVWYARRPRIVSWEYNPENKRLRVQRLVGYLRVDTQTWNLEKISRLRISPTGWFSGHQMYAADDADGNEFTLPIDPWRVRSEKKQDRAENAMHAIELVRLLVLFGHPKLIPYDTLADPSLQDMIRS